MKKSTIAKIAAFATAMLWGSTFAIGKIAAESFSASFIIALRFTVASVVLLVAAYPLRKLLNKDYWISGIWMGITIFASYFLQNDWSYNGNKPRKKRIFIYYLLCNGAFYLLACHKRAT